MLRVERMEVVGFKSFLERTTIDFPIGVTAVVGPNGCGKSNIADAMQWVLGEQSARALRGARMDDVIFKGTEGRGPEGMAEVTLTLVAREQPLPDGRTRVALTRRLYRTGESEYLLDGRPTRLTDIRMLLEQIRAGEKTYAIIDQSRVASFVISRPKERRQFIEDAAGISGYKQRRRLAELKFEATRANLLRVDDIVREVERQRRSLQRQASLARRARRLDEELKDLQTVWFRRAGIELARRVEALGESVAVHRAEAGNLDEERARIARLVAEARARLEAAHGARSAAVGRVHQAQLDEERIAAEIDAALERSRLLADEAGRQEGEGRRLALDRTARLAERESLARDVAALDERLHAFEQREADGAAAADAARREQRELTDRAARHERELFERLHERAELTARLSASREAHQREAHRVDEAVTALTRLDGLRGEAERAEAEIFAELARSEEASAAAQREVHAARTAEDDAAARLEAARVAEAGISRELGTKAGERAALESLEVRLAGDDAAREALEWAREGAFRAYGVTADGLTVEQGIEAAAEAYLAERLAALVVDGAEDVRAGAALGLTGRVRFLPLDATAAAAATAWPDDLEGDGRVLGRLADRIGGRGQHGELLARAMGDAVIVADLDAALDLSRRFPGFDWLTPQGHAVLASGIVVVEGSAPANEEGLLARARRREQLAREVDELQLRRDAAADALEAARDGLAAARSARAGAEEAAGEARQRAAAARMAREQSARDLARLDRETALVRTARESAERGRDEAERRAAALAQQEAQAEQQIGAARGAMEQARGAAAAHEDAVREAAAALAALQTDRRGEEERRAASARDLDRIDRELADLSARSESGIEAARRAHEEAERLGQQAGQRQADLERVRGERAGAETDAAARAADVERDAAAAHALDARAAYVAEELEGARARRETAALEYERLSSDLTHMIADCEHALGCVPEELPPPSSELAELERLHDDATLAARIAETRDKRDRVGPVNPLAEAEFEELSTRYDDMSRQKTDLEQSMEELNNSIKKMDRESRERFLEAFDAVRRHFKEQFAILFRGGRGDLILEEEDNPLESGIEILCQPPGKKLQAVSLLSGGEKALAATAVLFAIFRYAPPPFCLLDEVDAPLDDANVGRFADALRTFTTSTQFIVITHNKRSMEMADLLYGVSMPEPGVSRLVSMTLD